MSLPSQPPDGRTLQILSFHENGTKKKEEWLDEEGNWIETKWYRENGNLSGYLNLVGEAIKYSSDYSNVIETQWGLYGRITNYVVSDSYIGLIAYTNVGGASSYFYSYTYYENSDKVHYANHYNDNGQEGDLVAGDGVFTLGRAYESSYEGNYLGNCTLSVTGANPLMFLPDKPLRSDEDIKEFSGDVKRIYYASGKLKAEIYAKPDETETLYYFYLDEDFNGTGKGRLDARILGEVDSDGAIAYRYEYSEGTDSIIKSTGYKELQSGSYTNFTKKTVEYTYDEYGTLLTKSIYYPSGNLESVEKFMMGEGPYSDFYFYIDEDLNGTGVGRLGAWINNGSEFVVQSWHDNGNIKKVISILPFGEKTIWYRENGNLSKDILNYNDGNSSSSEYYDDVNNFIKTVWWYTNPIVITGYNDRGYLVYDYYYGSSQRLAIMTYYESSNTIHYNDYYYDDGQLDDSVQGDGIFRWSNAYVYLESGELDYYTTDRSVSGASQTMTFTLPTPPVASDAESLILESDLIENFSTFGAIPKNFKEFYDRLDSIKNTSSGDGVTIALLDSGFGEEDVLGHGTLMSGIIGVTAPKANILSIKVLDEEGETTNDIVSNAIKYAVDMGAKIISMSFSLFPVDDMLKNAISYAFNKGVMMVTSAGNENSSILKNSLASQNDVITVGSLDNDGSISSWSNYGDELDLLAPWDVISEEELKAYLAKGNILSEEEIAKLQDKGILAEEGTKIAGTSISAAFISGLMALIMEENPDMTSENILNEINNLLSPLMKDAKKKEKEITRIENEILSKQTALSESIKQFTGYNNINEKEDKVSVK